MQNLSQRDLMRYIETEYIIINNTPCEVCGGNYITEAIGVFISEGEPSTISQCVCEKCGNKKDFLFRSPVETLDLNDYEKELQ